MISMLQNSATPPQDDGARDGVGGTAKIQNKANWDNSNDFNVCAKQNPSWPGLPAPP
jgi:hypothetical protein